MDLSQQELPLTAYFSKAGKEAETRTSKKKKGGKPAKDSQCSRQRENVARSTASPLACSASRSKSRKTCQQLPTPVTSTRKRKRNGHLEEQAEMQVAAASTMSPSVAHDTILLDEGNLEFGPTPSKLSQMSRKVTVPRLSRVPLVTPPTGRRTTRTQPHPNSQCSSHEEVSVNHSPLARSKRIPLAPPRILDTVVPRALPSSTHHSARSTIHRARPSGDLDCLDPFHTREKDGSLMQRDVTFAHLEHLAQSKTLDGELPDGHVFPAIPVPSSQSQYLLHPDATPKRKRHSRHIETVISSQTQEERELTLSTPHRPIATANLPAGVSPGEYSRGSAQIPHIGGSGRKSQHVYVLGSTPIESCTSSPTSPSRSFAMKKTAGVLSLDSSPLRRSKLALHYSPSRKATTPRIFRHKSVESIPPPHMEDSLTESETESDILQMTMKVGLLSSRPPQIPRSIPDGLDECLPGHRRLVRRSHHNSDENITPAHIEDSLTESETESDILMMKMRAGLLSTLSSPSHVPRSLQDAADAYPPKHRRLVEDNLPTMEDDSVTEAESDTEILRCVAEIGNNRFHAHCPQFAKEDVPPPSIISPLVSPARSRTSAVPPVAGSSQPCTQEDAGLSIPESCVPYPSVMERPQVLSESLPSVVRDFLRMFPGDESYPTDFPESLRI